MLETKLKIINEHECAINLFLKYAFVGVVERKLPLFICKRYKLRAYYCEKPFSIPM